MAAYEFRKAHAYDLRAAYGVRTAYGLREQPGPPSAGRADRTAGQAQWTARLPRAFAVVAVIPPQVMLP
ncbi:hypothetical protein GCM10025734_75360 [Kitasatospora paranensis]